MHDSDSPARPLVRLRPVTAAALVLCLGTYLALLVYGQSFRPLDKGPELDFDIFHLVGRLAWAGSLAEAYSLDLFLARQEEFLGGSAWALWTYPPQFGAVVAALALMPHDMAFAAFTLGTLAAYLLVLRRLAGPHFAAVVLVMLPVLAGCLAIGQNGFLTGALAGLFAWLARRGRSAAGVPLGLMIIKPHLALGLGLWVLLARRWGMLAWAVAVVAGSSALCTLAFGPGIWPAFLHGVAESKAFMAEGTFLLQLMPSLYASLLSLGLGAGLAAGVHLTVALGGLAVVGVAVAQGWREDRTLAAAALATLLVSPYYQHYDVTLLGVGLALTMGDLCAPSARRLFPVVFGLVWLIAVLVGGYWAELTAPLRVGGDPASEEGVLALAGFVHLAVVALLLRVLWRAERRGEPPAR